MYKIKLFCGALALTLLCLAFPFTASAEAPAALSYADGTVIVNETLLQNADDLSEWFSAPIAGTSVTPSWNAETGRVKLTSGSGNTVVNLTHFPIGMTEYTISADLYVLSGDSSLAGMGINSAGIWSRGFYLQLNAPNSRVYLNNFGTDGKQKTGQSGGWKNLAETYTVGTSKVSVKFIVKNGTVTVYYDDTLIGTENLSMTNLAYDANYPFFLMRGNSVLELDNLTVYASGTSGTVAVDENQIGLVQNEIKFIGYQKSDVYLKESVSCYDVRLIAEVDALTYSAVGLRILATVDDATYVIPGGETTQVYTSINARNGDGQLVQVTPSEAGKYLVAIIVSGIPADTLPEFAVNPYVKNSGVSATYLTNISSFTIS